jgi:hypothetical protein
MVTHLSEASCIHDCTATQSYLTHAKPCRKKQMANETCHIKMSTRSDSKGGPRGYTLSGQCIQKDLHSYMKQEPLETIRAHGNSIIHMNNAHALEKVKQTKMHEPRIEPTTSCNQSTTTTRDHLNTFEKLMSVKSIHTHSISCNMAGSSQNTPPCSSIVCLISMLKWM